MGHHVQDGAPLVTRKRKEQASVRIGCGMVVAIIITVIVFLGVLGSMGGSLK